MRENTDKLLSAKSEDSPDTPAEDTEKLVHSLKTCQIELETQNEKLRKLHYQLKLECQEWKATFDSISDPISIHDRDFNILNVNRAFAEFFKTSPENIIGKKCYEFVHGSAGPWPNCPHKQALHNRKPAVEEFWEPSLGIHLQISASPIFDDSNEVVGSVHIAKDITARKKAEEALAKYAEEIRDLYNNAPVGYHSLDKDGVFIRINDTELSWLGYSREEIIEKKHVSNLLTPTSATVFRGAFPRFKEQGLLKGVEVAMVRKDGSILPVLVDATAVKDADGNFVMSRSTLYDISERKQAREALQKAHDELEHRVKERTAELVSANEQLSVEIVARRIAEEALRKAYDEIKQLKDQLLAENLYLQEEIKLEHKHDEVVGNSESIRKVLYQVEQVAATDSTVLLEGETGTGKELIAHAIHNLSARRARLLVKVNCAALPSTLIESELFGREKGAFTGAFARQMGRFELADKSTIFLDEIDGLPLELQSKLLRVLQNGEFERLGNPKTIKVDVRVIAATNKDLKQAVRDGKFREDLYYRLNIFPITIPPLRERRQDIRPLVWSFVKEFGERMGKRIESIPQKSLEGLQAYPWPGNVRELRNIVERSMIIATGPVLYIETPKMAEAIKNRLNTLEEVERQYIIQVLNTTGWKVSGWKGAAEILGINPKTLESRMKKLGIERKKRNS